MGGDDRLESALRKYGRDDSGWNAENVSAVGLCTCAIVVMEFIPGGDFSGVGALECEECKEFEACEWTGVAYMGRWATLEYVSSVLGVTR